MQLLAPGLDWQVWLLGLRLGCLPFSSPDTEIHFLPRGASQLTWVGASFRCGQLETVALVSVPGPSPQVTARRVGCFVHPAVSPDCRGKP